MLVDTVAGASVAQTRDKAKGENSGPDFDNFLLAASQNSKKAANPDEEPTAAQITYDEILETGFAKWTQEMRKEELEAKLREKVLASLGLTEEELGHMPADKITEIEKMIEEIMERAMTDSGQDKAKEQQEKGQAYVPVIVGTVA